jgi:D-apionolactonase
MTAAMTIDDANVEPSRAVKLCGTQAPDAPSRPLAAGPLAAELQNGQLRYVTFAGVEVVRGIAFLVRDENWGTYAPKIDELKIEQGADRFTVAYRAVCADARQRLVYQARISGSSDGSLIFAAVAAPETDVITNRTGFVVLHPAALSGCTVRVTHVDGREVDTLFPERICPAQPIFDIRALSHEVVPGLWATCRMEGDTFEMEDQRNWGDASYKTYIRPLALPWGYTLAKGSRHEQAVRLSFAGRATLGGPQKSRAITVTLGADIAVRMPDIGIGLPPEAAAAALAAIERLCRLAPLFLVCAIDARDGRGVAELEAYRRVAEAIPAKVVMEIVLPDEMDAAVALAPIAAAIARAGLQIDAVMISSAADLKSWQPGAERPERPTVEEICHAARAVFPGVRLGGGMLSYFTELNRKRPKPDRVDYVTHTTCSIVHAADDRSVMETLETLPAIIASTRAMIGKKPYRIGPSAIASRANPYASGTADNPANARICLTNSDPRQRGLFNAAWTLGYVAACAQGGLEAVAMGAATGPFGFIHRRADHAPPYFDSIDGSSIYPAFHVIAGLVRGSGRGLVETQVSDARRATALAWHEADRRVLWLANLTPEPLALRISGLAEPSRRLSVIDAAAFKQAVSDPGALDLLVRPFAGEKLNLDAYAVARID